MTCPSTPNGPVYGTARLLVASNRGPLSIQAAEADGADGPSDASYTRSLLDGGVSRCARKFGEEAIETVIAAMDGGK